METPRLIWERAVLLARSQISLSELPDQPQLDQSPHKKGDPAGAIQRGLEKPWLTPGAFIFELVFGAPRSDFASSQISLKQECALTDQPRGLLGNAT